MADHLGFKVQRLKDDQCRLLMSNVEVNDTVMNIELIDSITNIEALLRKDDLTLRVGTMKAADTPALREPCSVAWSAWKWLCDIGSAVVPLYSRPR
jgi:hypothetical protein